MISSLIDSALPKATGLLSYKYCKNEIVARRKYEPLELEKYFPLGSIKYTSPDSEDIALSSPLEIDCKPSSILPRGHELARHLDILFINAWIRVFVLRSLESITVLRVYILPDDVGRGAIPRHDKKARASLKVLMNAIDRSVDCWNAVSEHFPPCLYDVVCPEQDSLFYIFNTLKSPMPDPSMVTSSHASLAMQDLLNDSKESLGLKTQLFDYQKRSAAMMIQREAQPTLQLDSRLEVFHGPTGKIFYFDRVASQILSEKRCYYETKGGILAETMGHGKTLISLAVVLATKGHLPNVPFESQSELRPRSINEGTGAASLKRMTNRSIYRHAIPWKPYFNDLNKRGQYPDECQRFLEKSPGWYSIPDGRERARRISAPIVEKKIFMSSLSLIVVPPNLMAHWQQEIAIHLEPNVLSVLSFQDDSQPLPSVKDLLQADVILLSKTRFEDEMDPRKNNLLGNVGKSATQQYSKLHSCCCSRRRRACPLHAYTSALLEIHFLRFIVDEGHNFASSAGTRATVGLRSIHVERKWIISGTPSRGLLGLEIDMATDEAAENMPRRSSDHQQEVLERRKARPSAELEGKDLAALGSAVTNFLGLQPWANGKSRDDAASWQSYLIPDSAGTRKAGNLRCVLESLVVRHQMNQVERDLELPPLKNKVIFLEPCYSDKLSLNLFTLVLVANAVTSERRDQDYMFHPKNKPQLEQLIKNLRHCGFHWAGFSRDDILQPIRISQAYLADHESQLSDKDRDLLKKAIEIGQTAVATRSWQAFSDTKELGLFVTDFPEEYEGRWALWYEGCRSPLLLGATYLVEAQTKVDSNLYAANPFIALAGRVGSQPWQSTAIPRTQTPSPPSSPQPREPASNSISNKGVPKSSFEALQKLSTKDFNMHKAGRARTASVATSSTNGERPNEDKSRVRSVLKSVSPRTLPEKYSAVSKVKMVGTSSAKLSYLIDRVMELYEEEKILIFYEGDHIAYYIAQALEVLQVEHEIYATGLKLDVRSKYLEKFNKGQSTRVLLMDLKQASHGLHVASASRVFFVNPVWNPSIEAQAIKRAHRIGQTKPVVVETLVLKNTIEEQMLRRRRAMTTQEHQRASRSPLDDVTMNDIIRQADFHDLSWSSIENVDSQMAPLKTPQQVFGRELMAFDARPKVDEIPSLSTERSKLVEECRPPKRKAFFDDNAVESRPSKLLRFSTEPTIDTTPQAEGNFTMEHSFEDSHTAMSNEKFVDRKVSSCEHSHVPLLSRKLEAQRTRAYLPENITGQSDDCLQESTVARSPLQNARNALTQAQAVVDKWKHLLADGETKLQSTYPTPTTFTGIPSPGPSSGDEQRQIPKDVARSQKRRVSEAKEEEEEEAVARKKVRVAI